MQFYSLERQDEFVWALLGDVWNGTFLDIGCHYPYGSSNTYIFEKERNWTGLGFDIVDSTPWTGPFDWVTRRPKTKFIQTDVTKPEFTQILLDNVPRLTIDYVSLDVDTEIPGFGHRNLGWEVLPKMIDGGIKFKVMTMEHEYCYNGDLVRKPSRDLLHGLGYKMLFEDVCFPDGKIWEDWWIDPSYFPSDIFKFGGCRLNYNQCIDQIQKYKS
jgi:hypothetical protein